MLATAADADAHTALIRILLVNREQRILVTTGEDKLLKVWDLPSLGLKSSRCVVLGIIALSNDVQLGSCLAAQTRSPSLPMSSKSSSPTSLATYTGVRQARVAIR